jgi:hypothetical protein
MKSLRVNTGKVSVVIPVFIPGRNVFVGITLKNTRIYKSREELLKLN